MEQRICRRCLAKDMPDASYFDNMYEYIRQLDPEIKAEDPLYEERLSFCKECDGSVGALWKCGQPSGRTIARISMRSGEKIQRRAAGGAWEAKKVWDAPSALTLTFHIGIV